MRPISLWRPAGLAVLATVLCLGGTARAALNLASGAPEIDESGSWNVNPAMPNDTSLFGGNRITDGGDSTPASLGLTDPGYVPVSDFRQDPQSNYWLAPQAPQGTAGPLGYVTIDLGASVPIGEIDLYNTHNVQFKDRGTQNFHVDASNSVDDTGHLVAPTTILTGTLTDPRGPTVGPNDVIAPDIFTKSFGKYQYLTFVADSAFPDTYNGGVSPGLNEMRVFAVVPEPATFAAAGLILGALVLRRSRRA